MAEEGVMIDIGASVDGFMSGVNSVLARLDVLKLAAVSAGVGLAGVIAAEGVSRAQDYAEALGVVAQKAALSKTELDALESGLDAVRDSATGARFSKGALADALAEIAQRGRTAADTLKIVEAATALAGATGLGLVEATAQLNRTLEANGASASDAAHHADVLVAAYQHTSGAAGELTESLVSSTQQAQAFGLSMEENAAVLTVLADAGVSSTGALFSGLSSLLDRGTAANALFFKMGIALTDASGRARDLAEVLAEFQAKAVAAGRDPMEVFKSFGLETRTVKERVADLDGTVEGLFTKALAKAPETLSLFEQFGVSVRDAAGHARPLAEVIEEFEAKAQAAGTTATQAIRDFGIAIRTNKEGVVNLKDTLDGTFLSALRDAPRTSGVFDAMGVAIRDTEGHARPFADVLADLGARAQESGRTVERVLLDMGITVEQRSVEVFSLGESLKSAMSAAESGGSEATRVFERFGVEIRESDGAMRPILSVLAEFNEKTAAAGLTTEQASQVIVDAFGSKAAGAVNALRLNLDAVEARTTAFAGSAGVAAAAAVAMGETPQGRLAELNARMGDLALNVGDVLVRGFLAALDAAERLFGFYQEHKPTIDAIVAGTTAMAVAFGVHTLATSGAAIAAGFHAASLWATWAAVVALEIALAPITWILLAIGAAVAVLALAWTHNWFDIQGKTAAVVSFLGDLWEDLKLGLSVTLGVFQDTWERAKAVFDVVVDAIKLAVGILVGIWKAEFEIARDVVVTVFETIKVIIAAVFLTLRAIFTGDLASLGEIWSAALGRLGDLWGNLWSGIREKLDTGLGYVKTGAAVTWDIVSSTASEKWSGIKSTVGASVDGIVEWVKTLVPRGRVAIEDFVDNAKLAAVRLPFAIIEGIGDLAGRLWEWIAGGLHSVAERLTSWAKGVLGLSPTLTEIGSFIPAAIVAGLGNVGEAIWNGLKGGLAEADRKLSEWAANLRAGAQSAISAAQGALGTAGSAVSGALDRARDAVSGVVSGSTSDTGTALTGPAIPAEGLLTEVDRMLARASDVTPPVTTPAVTSPVTGSGTTTPALGAAGEVRVIIEASPDLDDVLSGRVLNRATRAGRALSFIP